MDLRSAYWFPIGTTKVAAHNRKNRKDILGVRRMGENRLASFLLGAKRTCIRNGMWVSCFFFLAYECNAMLQVLAHE